MASMEVTGSGDHTLMLWNLADLEKQRNNPHTRMNHHTREVSALTTTPDGRLAISGSGSVGEAMDEKRLESDSSLYRGAWAAFSGILTKEITL